MPTFPTNLVNAAQNANENQDMHYVAVVRFGPSCWRRPCTSPQLDRRRHDGRCGSVCASRARETAGSPAEWPSFLGVAHRSPMGLSGGSNGGRDRAAECHDAAFAAPPVSALPFGAHPDIEYVLDAEFVCRGPPLHFFFSNEQFDSTAPLPWSIARMGPYSIGRRNAFPDTFDGIERELWDLCELDRQLPLTFDLEKTLRMIGL
jgi:hypothetical protein